VSTPAGSPIRVLQVIAGLDPVAGGPPASAVATSLALRGRGVSSSFVYSEVPTCEGVAYANAELLQAAGVEIHRFPVTRVSGNSGVRWGVSPRLALWLLRNAGQFDVLHMHSAWTFTTAAGLVAAQLHRRVSVLSTHESLTNFDRNKSSLFVRLAKRILRRAYLSLFDLVVVSSQLEQRDSGDPLGRQSAIIPHAVRGIERTARAGGDALPLRVGFLGRLHPKKNLALLIEAIASIDSNVVLVVAGDGQRRYAEQLRSLALKVGIADRITWLGFIAADAKGDFLGSIDVLAMPSAYECFGVAAVEAMSAGVPVIVSPTVGVSEVVACHGAGVVALPDRDVLADTIAQFAGDRMLLQHAGSGARAAAAEFSLELHGARLHREYVRLLGDAATAERVSGRNGNDANNLASFGVPVEEGLDVQRIVRSRSESEVVER
jgi:glycosyltransferase involved in cell wall biosynthesis